MVSWVCLVDYKCVLWLIHGFEEKGPTHVSLKITSMGYEILRASKGRGARSVVIISYRQPRTYSVDSIEKLILGTMPNVKEVVLI